MQNLARAMIYDSLSAALDKKPIGIYPITVEGRKPLSAYMALIKRIRGRKDLNQHHIGDITRKSPFFLLKQYSRVKERTSYQTKRGTLMKE